MVKYMLNYVVSVNKGKRLTVDGKKRREMNVRCNGRALTPDVISTSTFNSNF